MSGLSITIGGIAFKNPILIASGVLGSEPTLYIRAWNAGVGGIVTKTFTYEAREGYKTPRIVEVECGYINAIGLENPGIDGMDKILDPLRKNKVNFIVSIGGKNIDEFLKLAEKAYTLGAKAVELNLSCPHAKNLGLEIGMDRELVIKIVKKIKEEIDMTVIPKFGYAPKIAKTLKLAEIAGADAITLINTIRAMKIDIWIKKPVLGNKIGGLSGCAIHPIAVATIYEAYKILEVPLIASGGIITWEDAVEFILAGATLIQIGSAIAKKGFSVIETIKAGLSRYLKEIGARTVRDIIGMANE